MAIRNDKQPKIKTVNFRFMFWFGIVFAIGAVAVSLMARSVICDNLLMSGPLYLFFALFGLFGLVGLIGVLVLLGKHLLLKSVLKYGTETVGKYDDVGRIISWGGGHRNGYGITTWFNQIIFTYTVDGEERRYKSCTVYRDNELDKLAELKTFTVKYKGKHAIICEKV